MTIYSIAAPDGRTYKIEGPEGATQEQVQAEVIRQNPHLGASNATLSPGQNVPMARPEATGPSGLEQLTRGTIHGGQVASAGLTGLLPDFIQRPLVKAGLSPSPEQLQQGKDYVANTGPLSTVGQMGADVASQILPTKKLSMATEAISGIPRALANIAGYAGMNSAMTPENRGLAAATGAGGSVLGNTMARLAGGPLRTAMTPEAETLMKKGVELTPGQMVTGADMPATARALRSMEDTATSIPFVGDVIKNRAKNSALSFNTQTINEALAPIGKKVTGTGDAAMLDALDHASNVYDRVLPDIHIPQTSLKPTIDSARLVIHQEVPTLGPNQEAILDRYIANRIETYKGDVSGTIAKKIDSELGENARKYLSGGPENRDLSAAFTHLRDQWRQSMVGATPEAKATLDIANQTWANLMPIQSTVEKSATGTFTPVGMRKAMIASDRTPTDLTSAAVQALPSTVADSGTAGRTLMSKLLMGGTPGGAASTGIAAALAGVLPTAVTGAGLAGLYTNPGTKYLASGAHPLLEALRKGKPYNRDLVESYLRQAGTQGTQAGFDSMNQ